jgi:GAF domain-containing protein
MSMKMSVEGLRVLLVMQISRAREKLITDLQELGFPVPSLAATANQALAKLLEPGSDYHGVMLDDNLVSVEAPTASGSLTEFISLINQRYPATEIILLSKADRRHVIPALQAGASLYLLKPVNASEVAALLYQINQRRKLRYDAQGKQLLAELLSTSSLLSSGNSGQEILEHILNGIRHLGFDRARLYLLTDDREHLIGRAQVGMKGNDFVGVRWPVADDEYLQELITDPRPRVFECELGKPTHPEDKLDKQGLKEWLCVPLMQSNEVIGLISADNKYSRCPIVEQEMAPLALFATHASFALHTAKLIENEQRRREHLSLLNQIHKFIQEAKDTNKVLDAVLTAVTASYGLQFNRALVLLLDDARRQLIGAAGIGGLDENEAIAVWAKQKHLELPDFDKYLERLKESGITLTPVGRIVRNLCFRLEEMADAHPFAAVLQNRECRRILPEQFSQLPSDLLEKFKPTSEMIIVPLAKKNQVIGALIADNKFNRAPIEETDIKLLMSFADTAAIAIDNIRLLNSFYTFSNDLNSYQSLNDLREAIVKETRQAAGASCVGLILIDEYGQATPPLTYPQNYFGIAPPMPRPDGISMKVWSTGQARTIPDIDKERGEVHPEFPKVTKAAACLPLCLPDKRIGVMWVDYDQPHHFSDFEVGVLQLFATHIANTYEAAQRIERFDERRKAYESLALHIGTQEVAKQLVVSARKILRADCAAFWFYDDKGGDKGGEFLGNRSVADGIFDEVWLSHQQIDPRPGGTTDQLLNKHYLLVRDVKDQEQRQQIGERTQQFVADVGGRGLLGLPLKFGEEGLGVLYLIYKRPIRYGEEWMEIAQSFAKYAALSLKNAKLFEQVIRTNEAARTVANVTKLGNIEKTLDEIVKEMKKATQCDAVVLFQHDQHSGRIDPHPLMPGVRYPERVLSPAEASDYWLVKRVLARDKHTIVTDVPADPDVGRTRFAQDEESKSFLAMPLNAIDQNVGAVFVTYRCLYRFTTDDLEVIELLANQAAVALRIARFIAERERRQEYLRLLLHKASSAIAASFGPDVEQVLDQLLEQAVKSLSKIKPSHHLVGLIALHDAETNKLTVKNIYPPEMRQLLIEKVGDAWALDESEAKLQPIGITGRAIVTKESQLVPNVLEDKDYLPYNPATRSELAVPLRDKDGIPFGVINVESDHIGGLNEEDKEMLERLADFTVVVRENEERYRQHLELQQTVQASYDLAFMSIASATWSHAVRIHAQTIKENAKLLHKKIEAVPPLNGLETLKRIEELCDELLDERKLTPRLSLQDEVQRLSLFQLLFDRIRRLCEQQSLMKNQRVEFLVTPDSDRQAIVKVNMYWLNEVIGILVNNAFKAMATVERKELSLTIKQLNNKVIVELSDTGVGIPAEIRAKLFKGRPETAKGRGMGLLIARGIIRAYGGDFDEPFTRGVGTTMRFWLPAA